MESRKPELLLLFVVLLLFCTTGAAFGDWDEGNPNKMHYPQLPKQGGWDVAVFSEGSIYLADDWQCSRTGPVSDIHFWVSWEANDVQSISGFAIRIWSDDPCGPNGWSEPNELLWDRDFYAGDFTVRDMNDDLQGWFDPFHSEWNQNDHTKWAQVNITDINKPFVQQEGKVYWLMIDMGGPGNIGWKESGSPHFRDNAVYANGGTNWTPLRDPLTEDSLDLAFVIDGPNFAKPLASHTKWSQPPIEIDPNLYEPNLYEPRYCGWDEMSWLIYPPSSHAAWTVVADDFRCLGNMPVTSIHWWGSHVNWDGNEPPQSPPATEEWRIRFWSNAAADTNILYSRPKKMLKEIKIPEQRVQIQKAGIDNSPRTQDTDDTCFQYYADLEPNEVFWQNDFNDQTQDDIFWISIEALDFNSINPHHWGWKTRPWHWMDDAVTMVIDVNTIVGTVVDPGSNQITPIKYQGESFDVSFELDTDPNYIKWEQLYTGIRDWSHYEDEPSTAITPKKWEQLPDPCWSGLHCHDSNYDGYYSWITLADDWLCKGGEVTDIHWWGSYEDRGSGIDHFHLSIHEPNAMNPCLPGTEVWEVNVPFTSIDEVDTGMVQNTGQTVYLYEYDLDTPFAQVEDQNYWLDITAYAVDPCDPALWYWQEMARHWTPVLCPAVSGGGPDKDWVPLDWPYYGYSDMAFVITSEANEPNDHLVADDWRCVKRTPVTAVVWWGSYIGYGHEAGSTGPFMPLPIPPDRFELTLWTDVPDPNPNDPNTYSHPGHEIWSFNASEYDEVLVGYDKKPHGEPNEPVFRYSVRLPEENWFRQPDVNGVFWLSVQAVYSQSTPNYTWGWTNHQHVFNDDAVSGRYDDANEVWLWEELKDQTGASEDMSFMLFTDPNECTTCANYNLDGTVNFLDFAEFANEWYWTGPAGGYNNGDLDCDGDVDLYDLDIFCQQWLQYCP